MSKGFGHKQPTKEEINQQNFFRALYDQAKTNKVKGLFIVDEGTVVFESLENLKRYRDALPLNDSRGHQYLMEHVEQSNPDTEIVLAIAGEVQIMSREKLEKVVSSIVVE